MQNLSWFLPFLQGLLLGLLAMVLHEVGHLVMALAIGVRIKTIGLRWKGMYVVREAGPPAKNLLVSLAGPLTNALLLLLAPLSYKFALANLCFAFFNLLPIRGSDGDRAWECVALMRAERAEKKARKTRTAPVTLVASRGPVPLVRQVTQSGD